MPQWQFNYFGFYDHDKTPIPKPYLTLGVLSWS